MPLGNANGIRENAIDIIHIQIYMNAHSMRIPKPLGAYGIISELVSLSSVSRVSFLSPYNYLRQLEQNISLFATQIDEVFNSALLNLKSFVFVYPVQMEMGTCKCIIKKFTVCRTKIKSNKKGGRNYGSSTNWMYETC